MPPYSSIESERFYLGKFIRIRGDIFVGADFRDTYRDIIEKDGLDEAIRQTRKEAPDEVDAGRMRLALGTLLTYGERTGITALGHQEQAREITLVHFTRQSPHHPNIISF